MRISIDTRTIKKGEYFVPIKGPNFDGNDFVNKAIKNGAKGVIEEKEFYTLAQAKIRKKQPVVIAIAGSIGKSTFRSYLTSVLKSKYKVLEGDQNTKLGLFLKIANDLKDQGIFVAEIGIDRLGEMEETSKFINPDFAVITKLGKEHIEYLKSFNNVIKENIKIAKNTKLKLCYLNKKDKKYYINFLEKSWKAIYFPTKDIPKNVQKSIGDLIVPNHDKDYLKAIYQIVSERFKYTPDDFINSLPNLIKPKGRLNVLKSKNGTTIIDDTYNAVCDQTIIEGLKFANKFALKSNKKLVVVISNMIENGDTFESQHKKVAKFINRLDIKKLKVVGENREVYRRYLTKDYLEYSDASKINLKVKNDQVYYIKATRRYKGPELVEKIKNKEN